MTQLLYIGNNLSLDRSNPSVMATLGPLLESEGYGVTYASSKANKIARLMDMLMAVWRQRKSVEIVLIDTYSTQNFYYAFMVSQLCRALHLPYIPILHGGRLPQRLQAYPKLCRRLFNHALTNVCPSKYLQDAFANEGYTNLTYAPNPIPLEQYPFTERRFDIPKLLWVRSFASLYNPGMAVQVLKRLQDLGIPAELCMVGPDSDGSLQQVKDLATELGVTVQFTGKLSKAAWMALSQDHNIFINTTHVDNTPVSVIEAMALGLPVVSTNVGGMPYLIEHETTGLLVKPTDVDAMVAAILQLIEHPEERSSIIKHARVLAESFDWGVVKQRWKEVLD